MIAKIILSVIIVALILLGILTSIICIVAGKLNNNVCLDCENQIQSNDNLI